MYVRDLSLNVFTGIDKKLDGILYKNKAYEKKIFNGISFILIDIYQAYQAMVKDLKSKGVKFLTEPHDTDYSKNEFSIVDNQGHTLSFGEINED